MVLSKILRNSITFAIFFSFYIKKYFLSRNLITKNQSLSKEILNIPTNLLIHTNFGGRGQFLGSISNDLLYK